MNAVGIDVSKGKSMIAVMRPGKETVIEPFEVGHTDNELIDLAKVIQSLDGETRVVMERPATTICLLPGCYTMLVSMFP